MWLRGLFALGLAALALVGPATPARAGGWAISSLDALPDEGFRAGETYRVGYTILQHGQTPFRGAQTAVEARAVGSGETLRFRAVADGPVGHYVAEVRFPAAGEFEWRVDQEPFAPHPLGQVTVAPPVGQPAETPSTLPVARVALPLLAALALAIFIWQLFAAAARGRRARMGEPAASGEPG